ncbi:MAG TPA: phosphate signaling complex protein PhoU [Ktedonobacterales bacterium]|nr:phosphate signaling complex protein PhoU [Ktedonobacterales bacterium]
MARDAFQREMLEIQEITVGMAALVERALAQASQAFLKRDHALARRVRAEDAQIDELLRTIRIRCTDVTARKAPVDRDLRELSVAQLVASELERMGDHAVGIAKRTLDMRDEVPPRILGDLAELAKAVMAQVRAGIEAFATANEQAARDVCRNDDAVDKAYKAIRGEVVTYMEGGGEAARVGSGLLFLAHDFERIGDRMTNICEDIVYLVTGQIEELN